ncbi:hypothetical protein SEA_BRAYBEAST_31 [Arthrobacter phage BrayBeast]
MAKSKKHPSHCRHCRSVCLAKALALPAAYVAVNLIHVLK